MAQTAVPPNSIDIRQDLRPSLARIRPLKGRFGSTANRVDVREDRAKRPAEITNADGLQISSMPLVRKEKAMGSWMIASSPQYWNPGSPHWYPAIQYPSMPERRGIVAQVRRLALKNRGLRAVQESRSDATIC